MSTAETPGRRSEECIRHPRVDRRWSPDVDHDERVRAASLHDVDLRAVDPVEPRVGDGFPAGRPRERDRFSGANPLRGRLAAAHHERSAVHEIVTREERNVAAIDAGARSLVEREGHVAEIRKAIVDVELERPGLQRRSPVELRRGPGNEPVGQEHRLRRMEMTSPERTQPWTCTFSSRCSRKAPRVAVPSGTLSTPRADEMAANGGPSPSKPSQRLTSSGAKTHATSGGDARTAGSVSTIGDPATPSATLTGAASGRVAGGEARHATSARTTESARRADMR